MPVPAPFAIAAIAAIDSPAAPAPRRRVAVRAWLLAVLLGVATTASAQGSAPRAVVRDPAEPRTTVRDPHYGAVLFDFYQQRYFSAATTLELAQHFRRLPRQNDEAEVLRGGLLLSFGMPREAREIFTRLAERGAALPVRDRAWFYLAKVNYQRGLLREAEAALARIQGALPEEIDEERSLLAAQLLMLRNEFAEAAKGLGALARRGRAGPVARYNLGIALIRSGERARGEALLEALGTRPAGDEEAWTLRDRANMALGFAALQYNDPTRARAPLERVRLESLQANAALLGLGWAAVAEAQPRAAFVPWAELQARDPSDPAVLESRLAVPYVLDTLGARAEAVGRYTDAVTEFAREHARLDASIAAVRAGTLLVDVEARNPGPEIGWFWRMQHAPAVLHPAHLHTLLAQNDIQEAYKNLRDLRFVAAELRRRQAGLPELRTMLATRSEAMAERLPRIEQAQRAIDLAPAGAQREQQAAALAQARTARDGQAFADARQREQLARVQAARAALAALDAAPAATTEAERAALRERLRRLDGALAWTLARAYPVEAWEATRDLATTDATLAQARQQQASLTAALQDEPQRLARWTARLDALEQELAAQLAQVETVMQAQREQLQALAVAALERQQARMAEFTAQARFAIALIQDSAQPVAGRGSRAAP
jgi:hypothetical protein